MDFEEQKASFLSSLARGEKLVSDGPIRVTDVTNMSSISGRACLTTEQIAFWTTDAIDADFTILLDNVESVEAASDATHKLSKVDVLHRVSGRLLKTTFFCSSDMGKAILALTEVDEPAAATPVSHFEDSPFHAPVTNDDPFSSHPASDPPPSVERLDDGDELDEDFQWDLEQLASSGDDVGSENDSVDQNPWADLTETEDDWGQDTWGSLPFDDSDGETSKQPFETISNPQPSKHGDKAGREKEQPQIRDLSGHSFDDESDDDFFTNVTRAARGERVEKQEAAEQPKAPKSPKEKKLKLPSKPSLPKRPEKQAKESSFDLNTVADSSTARLARNRDQPRFVIAVAAILLVFIGTIGANQYGPLSSGSDDFVAATLAKVSASQADPGTNGDTAAQAVVNAKLTNELALVQIDQNNKLLEILSALASLTFTVIIIGVVLIAGWFVKSGRPQHTDIAPETPTDNSDW